MAASLPSPIVSSKRSSAFFTMEDARAGFNIFCCICGIGSLSMPSNYARAGPVFATIALLFMAFANIYATIALSKTMLVAPSSVRTYSDLGRWAMGKTGYYLVMVSQLGVCLLTPCAFLVLGGQLLDVLFPDAFSQIFWIVFMAVLVLPVALIPTLKESAGAAVVGCLGTIISDVIAIAVLLYNMRGHSSVPSPDVTFHQVITSFGNLSLAYGAAIIIPDLQRQHSNPRRMPRIVLVSLGLASAFFLVLAVVGYSAGGCQISGNILFSIANTSDPTAATSLGFIADRGAVLMSFLFMQLHLSIAFSTILQPAFYTLETLLLGMHKVSVLTDDIAIECELQEKVSSHNATTPSGSSDAAFSALESNFTGNDRLSIATQQNEDESEYKGAKNVMRYVPARILLIAVQAVASILLRDHFLDIVDFTGATFITVCCLLLPLVFYLKVLWSKLPIYEKIVAPLVILICGAAGIYVMIYAGKNLFNPDSSSATFPYCDAEYQDEPYYVRNSTV